MRTPREDLQVLLPDGSTLPLSRFIRPTATLMAATLLLIASMHLPYWSICLHAPQYPQGLTAEVYINHLGGDIDEIDELNHYLGMPSLREGGKLERSVAVSGMVVMALMLVAGVFIHDRRAMWLALPAIFYPLVFLADMKWTLYRYGHSIDPKAALGSAVAPFTPPVLGTGSVGQFATVARFGPGLVLAISASAVVLAALWMHRAAWRPVVLAREGAGKSPGGRPLTPTAAVGATLVVALLLLLPRAASASSAVAVLPGQRIADVLARAPAGATVRVPPGIYHEHLVVRRPVTLVGVGRPVIDGDDRGTVVRLAAPDTVLRGFEIRGSGRLPEDNDAGVCVTGFRSRVEDNVLRDVLCGIFASGARDVVIRGNDVSGKPALAEARKGDGLKLWSCRGARVEGNRVHETRDVVAWYCERVRIRRNRVENGRYGIHFMYSDGARVEENELRHDSVGIYMMYSHDVLMARNRVVSNRGVSGYGFGFKDVDNVEVRDNTVLDNRSGFFMDDVAQALGSYCQIRGNLVAYNDVGVSLLPSVRHAAFTRNTFWENGEQVAMLGRGAAMTDVWRNNAWSDYAGYDADHDGVGDVPYRAEELFENLSDRFPDLRFFHASLAQQAVDAAARFFPLVKPVPKLVDPRPLMAADGPGAGMPASASGLLAFAALPLALAFTRRRERGHNRRFRAAAPVAPAREAADPAAIALEGLTRRFGDVVAVDGVTLHVAPGEAVALWGSNGAGKTTILRCLLGLIRCAGTLRVAGLDVKRDGVRAREHMGYVPQELRFHDDLTVDETVALYAALRQAPAADLARVGLEAHRKKRVGQLSGGMKQRLALALALLGDPAILLLDEPTSNLDRRGRREFMELLRGLKAQGKTMLFSAHHVDEVAPIADRVVMLESGRLIEDCDPGRLTGCE